MYARISVIARDGVVLSNSCDAAGKDNLLQVIRDCYVCLSYCAWSYATLGKILGSTVFDFKKIKKLE